MDLQLYQLVFALMAIVIAISLHEMMHAFTSNVLGDDTAHSHGRVTLNPLAHIDPFMTIILPLMLLMLGAPPIGAARPVPFNPSRLKFGEYGMAMVAFAGPLTNLLLALVGGVCLQWFSAGVPGDFLRIFIVVNTGFFVFNMLPIPPLDGSRVLYTFAPDWLRSIMDTIERFGLLVILVILIFLLPLLQPLLSWVNTHILELLL